MQPIPHDVPNCAWHIFAFADEGGQLRRNEVFYATDCGSLDGVEAKDYDLYLIEANYGEEEIQERMPGSWRRAGMPTRAAAWRAT